MNDNKKSINTNKKSLHESISLEIKQDRIAKAKSVAKKIMESKKNKSFGKKRLNERAEMSIKNIDLIELHELLANLKENIEYDLNDDLDYFRIIVGADNNRAYIDLETRDDVEPISDYSVEDILSARSADDYGIDDDEFNRVKSDILKEKKEIETKLIPKLAKDWGFRKIKEAVEPTAVADKEVPDKTKPQYTVEDMLFANLVRDDKYFVLKGIPMTKYYDAELGEFRVANHYDMGQMDMEYENGEDISISVADAADTEAAKYIANAFKLSGYMDDWAEPKRGYSMVYTIHVPQRYIDMPAAEYCVIKGLTPDMFQAGIADRVRSAMNKVIKKMPLTHQN